MLGFKRLTADNWTDPDPVNRHFARISPIAGPISMEGDDWAREFLAVSVADHVPKEVADLFAVARGAMLYGWFFYPLFRIGEEQLFRVLETAARIRYAELGGGAAMPSFKKTIDYLLERGVIAADQLQRWEAARQLRNHSSHPSNTTVTTPGSVLGTLALCAGDLDALFRSGS